MPHDDHVSDSVAGDALSALIPFGNTIGSLAGAMIRKEVGRLTSRALKAAESSSGMSREDLTEWLENDPRAIPLYLKVLWAAGMNGHDATLRAMGAVLGDGVRAARADEDEGLQRAELALQAMSQLGPLHFRVLASLNDGVIVVAESGAEVYSQFVTGYVAERLGLSEALTSQCLLNLANSGLAELMSVFGDNAFPVTDLGRAVLRASEQVA